MDANNFRCDSAECGCHVTSFQWISKPLKAIYFESSKCCSSSIRERLGIGTMNFGIAGKKFGKHKWTNLQGYYNDPERWKDYYKFGFVRNTWDKLVSVWAMYTTNERKAELFRNHFKKEPSQVGFEEFVAAIATFKNHHWELQVRMIPEELDLVGRFETFSSDWGKACREMGLAPEIHKSNWTTHRNYKEHYTDELERLVAEIYAPDIDRFGYRFDGGWE